jgi:hypothetical protein
VRRWAVDSYWALLITLGFYLNKVRFDWVYSKNVADAAKGGGKRCAAKRVCQRDCATFPIGRPSTVYSTGATGEFACDCWSPAVLDSSDITFAIGC